MSMFDDVVLGLGRTGYINESVEPELQDEEFDSIEGLDESVDPMEYITNAIYVNEMNMSNLDKAIMCEEYMYLRENGTEMVYEAVNIKGILESAKKAILNLWNRIKTFLKTQADKLASKVDKAFLKKYKEKAAGKKAKIKVVKSIWNGGITGIEKNANDVFDDLEKLAKKVASQASSLDEKTEMPEFDKWIKDQENNKKGLYNLLKSNTKDYKSADSKEDMVVEANKAIEYLEAIVEKRRGIKNAYDKSKKNINEQLKAVKVLENSYKKFKVIPTEMSSKVHQSVRIINKIGSWLASANRMELKQLSMLKSMAKAAIIQASGRVSDTGTDSDSTSNTKTGADGKKYTDSGILLNSAVDSFSDIIM